MKDKEAQLIWETLQKADEVNVDDQGRPERMMGKPNFMYGKPANSTGQVAPVLDAAAGGDFISYLNSIEFTEEGAAALVEWLTRYNLGAS